MRPRVLNAISVFVGAGITAGLFLSIAHFLRRQESASVPPVLPEDLEAVSLAIPPPPPPRPEEKPATVPEASDAIAVGFAEEPSSSPVKIAPTLPNVDELLPMAQLPTQVAAGPVGLESTFKPKLAVTFDENHVYQKKDVDKLPFVISRPDPSVPASVLGATRARTVTVVFVVGMRGDVSGVRVVRSSDSAEFDTIITENIQEWRFSPAIKNGKPVRCLIMQQVKVQMGTEHRDIFSL